MMSEHYVECRALPTINETFPQFSARLSSHQPHQLHLPITSTTTTAEIPRNNLILSPLDLSLRAGVNIVPITPPSTPSPPRKRSRFMSDEQYLWRPHVMATATSTAPPPPPPPSTTFSIGTTEENPFLYTMTDTTKCVELRTACGMNEEAYQHAAASPTAASTHSFCPANSKSIINNFEEITRSQRSESALLTDEYQRHIYQPQRQHFPHTDLPAIYMSDETIVLTEDEDDEKYEDEEDDDYAEEQEEENETLLSSQDLNEDDEINEPLCKSPQSSQSSRQENPNPQTHGHNTSERPADDDEEEYVDIVGDDDEDDTNPLSAQAVTMLRLQSQTDFEKELERSGSVLTRNKLFYDNEELHNRAIDGLAKLFDSNFQSKRKEKHENFENLDKTKTYIDLTNCPIQKESATGSHFQAKEGRVCSPTATVSRSYRTHKAERKRMKLRKHMSLDEETLSPVSGTIIRKLRDDEELVVRKGDIDPAFNVVEVTEEAKAILASIDNKIGAYLCQLCRTLYDDAFKLAQHRCPRIVHIEYKCSECEKVFNCPANLASHRRWHKPKSELLASSQSKKRTHAERNLQTNATNAADKIVVDDGVDGIFACNQCGKAFRRHAYLKKHQASHQMLENLKSLDIFKNSPTATITYPTVGANLGGHTSAALPTRIPPNPLYPALQHPRPYPPRFAGFPFPNPFDHGRFYTLGEFYLSQQLERSSAFQYVQQANHLRNLNNVAGNFINRPVVPSPIIPLTVK